jgi:hypothetical protein
MCTAEKRGLESRLQIHGVQRLLDEHNRESAENVCNWGKGRKLRQQLLSTYSSPCFSLKIVYNYGFRGPTLASCRAFFSKCVEVFPILYSSH